MSKQYEADWFIKTGGTSSQYLMADGTISTGPSGGVDVGTGTANKVAKFSDSDTITDSIITDDGTNVGIGDATPNAKLHVKSSSSGASTHSGTLIIEKGSSPSIQLLSANTQTQSIKFGDPQDGDVGGITYSHSANEMKFVTNASDRVTIDSSGDVVIGGNITAGSLIKSGGTSSQFLKADGSVDSSTYSTTDTQPLTTEEVQDIVGAMVQSNVENLISVTYSDNDGKLNFDASAAEVTDFVSAANGGTFNGALTIDSDTDTIFKLNSTDNGPLYVTYSRSDDRHAYIGFGGSSDNFTIMSEETGGQIILGTAATTRLVIDDDGYVNMRERVGIGGDFTPQKALHLKNAAPVFRFEDSDITGGYLDMIKSSRNMRFDLEQDDATAATNFNFRIGGTTHLYMKNNFVGVMNDSPSEALDVTGNVAATSFVKTGGTSAQFLKADGSVDSNTYAVGTIPTDFVSAASGGSFGGGIVADSFTITGLSSGDSFLKANGSLDGTVYNSGAGASGGIAIYNGTNTTTDSTRLQYNFLSNTLTAFDLNVDNDLQVAGDATVTGSVEADTYKGQVILLTANLSHTSTTTGYYNIPFNSLGESISPGEQHYFVSTGYYRLRTIIMKNTGTGGTPTITANNFRVVKNGTTLWTGASNLFGTGVGAYCSNGLTDTNAIWSFGDMIQFQFNPTGLWRDAAITMVLEVI